ncbi:MAG TPA: class I SAM-dependent methyltransferase [Planctomycetota bacterium]|nr:class I SAM-dependent methyltransferase [Planctomycetota bacterium]
MTATFPVRMPEKEEAMSPEESSALAGWQASPQGRAIYAALAAHVITRTGIRTGRVISVGEGEGLFAAELAARLPDATVIGTDLDPNCVARARARHRRANLRFEVASASAMERLAPASLVVCISAFHHFRDARTTLVSMGRALVPGGVLYVQDLRRDAAEPAYKRVLTEHETIGGPIARIFTESVRASYTGRELEALFRSALPRRPEVASVAFGRAARAVIAAIDPAGEDAVEPVVTNVRGLWIEALYRS